MPVTVIVRSGESRRGSPEAPFSPSLAFDGTRVVIGRGASSDVRLPDPSVSFRHATLRANGSDYAIVDEGSTNGTWVGGVKLAPNTPRVVRSGDLVRVGRVWLELVVGSAPATPDLGLATRELALSLVRRAMDAMGDDTVMKVRVAEGPDVGATLPLVEEGRRYVLGRAERCELPLADEDASREHAAVIRRGPHVFLHDLGSRNGVFLGDSRVPTDREVPWRPPVMARIGRSVLSLDEPVSLALAEIEASADERLDDTDLPPEPPPPSASSTEATDPREAGAPAVDDVVHSARPTSQAPMAYVDRTNTTVVTRKKKKLTWTVTDFVVLVLALAVIAASIAGLVWVLRVRAG